jgi:hypothetical protein
MKGSISQRTVSRVIIEGYIASQIQLGHEMKKAKGMQLILKELFG